MRIVVLGMDGTLPSGVAGLCDVFWLANEAIRQRAGSPSSGATAKQFELVTASPRGRSFLDGRGARVRVDAGLFDLGRCDAVLIPGIVQLGKALQWSGPVMQEIGQWLRKQHAHGTIVAGACKGVFVLGEAGLLNERRCTTTWWLHDELLQRYPRAHAIWGSALIDEGRVVTSGGPLSWVDSALHVIRMLAGDEAARLAADFAVVDNIPPAQTIYMPAGYAQSRDPWLIDAERTVRQLGYKLNVADLAVKLATSERTLHRRMRQLIHESPKAFIDRIRLEDARTLLENGAISVKRVAQQTGYADEGSFRRAFTRFTGMTPSAYRQWSRKR
ncbi:GlxA family transcriptional regulator (plasmid) [Ralstonia sp. 25C]|uniref:GlxA family transcriptional regulator n=1 Tax=Ralstonia sp. 25C TaxID=3447363 RepID=UPI003F74EC38